MQIKGYDSPQEPGPEPQPSTETRIIKLAGIVEDLVAAIAKAQDIEDLRLKAARILDRFGTT